MMCHWSSRWPSTWTDRLGRDRTPVSPGQELAGVVTALGYGTRGPAFNPAERIDGKTIIRVRP
jgi:hypothetical protein